MKYFLIVLFIVPIFVCAQSVEVAKEDNVDWSQYSTFAIGAADLVTVLQEEIDKEKILNDLKQVLIREVESKGYLQGEHGNADIRIAFTAEIVQYQNTENIGPLGQEPIDDPTQLNQDRTWSQERHTGNLAMELTDAKTGKGIWRSQLSLDYSSEEVSTVLAAAVVRSIRKLPKKE